MYCVIDIGSNTIRLVIYTLEDGQLKQALSSKATAGLAGFVEDGALSEEGIERMLGVLRRFRGVLSLLPVPSQLLLRRAPVLSAHKPESLLLY